jgi:hypothetical protein
MAPFAFQAYDDPPREKGHWHTSGNNTVAVLSERFLREAFAGALRVRVVGVKQQPRAKAEEKRQGGLWFPASLLPALGGEGESRRPLGVQGASTPRSHTRGISPVPAFQSLQTAVVWPSVASFLSTHMAYYSPYRVREEGRD